MTPDVTEKHGTPACSACGALVCVVHRGNRPNPTSGLIREKTIPEPADDVDWVQCGGCGEPLWGEPDD